MSGHRLYIAAKPPVSGLVKTRLARAIGEYAATALYAAFLVDIAAVVRDQGISAGWFIPSQPEWEPPLLGPRQLPTRWQRGASWSRRQAQLFADCFQDSEGPVVLMASDSPQLTGSEISAAVGALAECDVVLGPVLDGGYYLVGMRAAYDILGTVEMTTERVSAEVLAGARALHLTSAVLPATFDVDVVADLDLLAAGVATRPHLLATASALAALVVPAR
ncbi:MAG TPA: DUF2064 domain-containing protein [Candidatus Dormibacteraeota bacterium]|nr:DUF2064 domain-containing protein [Candidatus Dormibacteraeota bacterium]